MASAIQEAPFADQEEAFVKRRKLQTADQERALSGWFASTQSWSPNESADSSRTFVESPASFRGSTPYAETLHALDQHIHELACHPSSFTSQEWLRSELNSSQYLTPPAQRIVLPSQQQAPKLHFQQLSLCQQNLAPFAFEPQPFQQTFDLPSSGTKRLRLDSYNIASQLASQNGRLGQVHDYPMARRQKVLVSRQRVYSGNLHMPCSTSQSFCHAYAGKQDIQMGLVHPSLSLASMPTPYMRTSPLNMSSPFRMQPAMTRDMSGSQRVLTCAAPTGPGFLQYQQMSQARLQQAQSWSLCLQQQWQALPRCPASSVTVLEQWACALGLLRDTVQLTVHMFDRVQAQVRETGEDSAKTRGLYLLGCVWVAAKHEECRFGMPSAQKIASLLPDGAYGGVRSSTVNRAELCVLDLLGWQPLKGWDDLRFVKGKPRDLREVAELRWLSCGV